MLSDLWIYKPSIPHPSSTIFDSFNSSPVPPSLFRKLLPTMDFLSFLLKNLLPIMLTAIITFFLSEPVRLYYGYFIHITRNAERLFDLMKHLEGKMKDLPRGGNAAQAWVRKMDFLKQEAGSFEAAYKTWEHHGFFFRLILRYGIAMKAGDLFQRAEDLAKVNVDAERVPPLPPVQERDTPDCVLGLDSIFQEALGYIQWESRDQHHGARVIGIFGIGGVGKTTLLKKINNFFASRPAGNVFDHVVWATVSKDVNLEKLQKDVAHGLGLSLDQNQSLEQKAADIFNYMKDKSFLLLLDDLWAPLDLEKLGIPDPQEGGFQLQRRVAFTTRFQNVCDSMQAMDAKKERIKVAFLSKDHAWQLFRRMLGDKFNDSDKEIGNLAKGIAEECQGLPLALKVIGAAMSSRKSLDDWEDALESLKESQPISGMEENVFTLLKHSYDNLNDDKLRKCFLCCALWLEDFDIDKDELIRCWMGLELLDGSRVKDRYRAGRNNIQILKDACLLEANDDEDQTVKMHDVIRDMALHIASYKCKWIVRAGVDLEEASIDVEQWIVRAGVHLEEASIDVEQWVVAECESLMHGSLKSFSLFGRDQGFVEGALPDLSILILRATHGLKISSPNNFIPCMRNLTYLDLSGSFFNNIPLYFLPPELQYLNLSYTNITSLPPEFGQLKKLRYLFLKDTEHLEGKITLEMMPRALEMLDLSGSSLNWEVEGETIFRGLKKLQVIQGITVRSTSQLRLLSELSYVQIWSIDLVRVNGLTSLDIRQSFVDGHSMRNDLTKLKVDFGEEGSPGVACNLSKLEYLHLCFLDDLENIIWRGVEPTNSLPRLRSVLLDGCDKLKNVSWVSELQCLESLEVSHCWGMATLIDENEIGEGAANLAFPRLKKLTLFNLPELGGIFHEGLAFPSLKTIYVSDCPKLRRLPFRSPMTNSKIREKLQVLEAITVRSTSQLRLLSELFHVQIWSIEIAMIRGLTSLDIRQSFVDGHSMRNDLTKLKVDFGEEGSPGVACNLSKLENLHLCFLDDLENIIWRGVEPIDSLPRLRSVGLYGCDKLKNVSWVLQLQCLESLSVFNCKGMTTLIDENEIREGAANLAFPRLKKLILEDLPELEGIFHEGLAFPSLKVIYVHDCPELRRLPFRSPMTNSKMKKIVGSQAWWDGLQWEDESIKTSLHTHFIAI